MDNSITAPGYDVEIGANDGSPNDVEYVSTLRSDGNVVRAWSGHGRYTADRNYILTRTYMDIA